MADPHATAVPIRYALERLYAQDRFELPYVEDANRALDALAAELAAAHTREKAAAQTDAALHKKSAALLRELRDDLAAALAREDGLREAADALRAFDFRACEAIVGARDARGHDLRAVPSIAVQAVIDFVEALASAGDPACPRCNHDAHSPYMCVMHGCGDCPGTQLHGYRPPASVSATTEEPARIRNTHADATKGFLPGDNP